MSVIKVRNIDFQFGPDIPFQWNPGNPDWGNFVNLMTIIIPGFERYVIKSARAALPRISDPRIAEETDLFCKQEAQHSKHHIEHLKVLTHHYPGLQSVHEAVMDSYAELFEREPLEFHLAYATIAELYLGPLARYVVENRQALMPNADARIASFIIWHFIEEFEHKNAALDLFNAVVGSYWYRVKCFPKVARHLMEIKNIVEKGLAEHAPAPAGHASHSSIDNMLAQVSAGKNVVLYYGWFCTLLPYHKPDNILVPQWIKDWHKAEQAGTDMTRYYPELAP